MTDNKGSLTDTSAEADEASSVVFESSSETEAGKGRLISATKDPHRILSYREHALDVLSLTGPMVMCEVFQNLLPVIDVAFVGNLPDNNDLAAAALATAWFNIWNAAILGFNTAIDTFLSQAYGAKELQGYAMWTGTGLAIAIIVTCFIAGLVALCGPVMKLFGQDEVLAERAGHFSYALIPGMFPFYTFKVLLKYLQCQDIVIPAVWIGFFANGVNILLNWLLIYKLDMGLNGAPWATSFTRFVELVVICGYMVWNRHSAKLEATWPILNREMWTIETLSPFCKLACSGAFSLSAEMWSYDVLTILAGLFGTVELTAQVITMSISAFLFDSFAFAIGMSASIRVAQWMGDGSPDNAQRSTIVSFLVAFALQAVLIAALLSSKDWIGAFFSSDDEVVALVASLIPTSCVLMLGDSFQATTGAIRGLGRQRLVLLLNVLAYWILAIPIGSLLAFVGNMEVAGLWWGCVVGVYVAGMVGISAMRYSISWETEIIKAAKRVSMLSSVHVDSDTHLGVDMEAMGDQITEL